MSPGAGIRIAVLLFVVAILQVSAFSSISTVGGGPNVLLVALVSVALLRGAVTGAVAGFAAGLVVDLATLGTLGLTALLLTLVGYWAGRYGETTGRARAHAPLAATVAATLFVAFGDYALYSLLGEPVETHAVLAGLPAAIAWNAALTYPIFGLLRRLIGASERSERAREVEILV